MNNVKHFLSNLSDNSGDDTVSNLILKLKYNYKKVEEVNKSTICDHKKMEVISELSKMNISLSLELKKVLLQQLMQTTNNHNVKNILITRNEFYHSKSYRETYDDYATAIYSHINEEHKN
jgi:hypothetical protein